MELMADAEQIATLARRLAGVVDLPAPEQLSELLAGADWAAGHATWASAGATVVVADFGCPRDLYFDDDDAYGEAADRLYEQAEALAQSVADRLGLEPAWPLDIDPLEDHPRVRLRCGHWSVTVAAAQYDSDLPLQVVVDLSYGADLPRRLATLAGPPPGRGPVDWAAVEERVGLELPDDYRWLLDWYGPGTFDGYLTLLPVDALSAPVPGRVEGPLRVQKDEVLPVATTAGGATVSLVHDTAWGQIGRASCRERVLVAV